LLNDEKMAPGLMLVNTSIVKPDIASPKAYEEWYTGEHIPEIADIPGWSVLVSKNSEYSLTWDLVQ